MPVAIQQYIPVMQVAKGHATVVDLFQESLQVAEALGRRRRFHVAEWCRAFNPLGRQGVRVDATEKRGDSGETFQPTVVAALPCDQPASQSLTDPPPSGAVVFHGDSPPGVAVDYDIGLGPVASGKPLDFRTKDRCVWKGHVRMKGATSNTDNAPTITPSPGRDNRLPLPTQDQIARGKPLSSSRGSKAAVLRVEVDGASMLVKTFRGKPWLARLLGRWLIARECAAYEALRGVPGVPCFLGRLDALTLVLEWIDGEQLGYVPDREQRGLRAFPRLVEGVERIHERGVVHWDLRSRHNVLIGRNDDVHVVDFATAIRFKPGGLLHSMLFERLTTFDRSALIKWKEVLRAGPYNEDEKRSLGRFRRWRGLWFVNHKPAKRDWRDEP